jgi:hypothetical protein
MRRVGLGLARDLSETVTLIMEIGIYPANIGGAMYA